MEFLVGGGSFDSLELFRLVHLGIGSYLCWLGRICKLIRRPFGCNGLGLLGALLMNEPSLPSRYGECFCCLISFVSLWFGSLQIRGECLLCCLIWWLCLDIHCHLIGSYCFDFFLPLCYQISFP